MRRGRDNLPSHIYDPPVPTDRDPDVGYRSPLETRNASAAMRAAWSA